MALNRLEDCFDTTALDHRRKARDRELLKQFIQHTVEARTHARREALYHALQPYAFASG
jgi:hypothetical protein